LGAAPFVSKGAVLDFEFYFGFDPGGLSSLSSIDPIQEPKTVMGSDFVQESRESVVRSPRSRIWTAPLTNERTKMQVSASVRSPKRKGHRRKTRTLKTEGCATRVSLPSG
jgi:hypothetical protein